ncbi:TonB-dependent receptor [Hydrocarboniphaga sp.]|uniref:TonB-dependent receptor n=1 Tax=Hydrocarboniphaga sp. TaxID=2033016 RepID=UPI003D10886E
MSRQLIVAVGSALLVATSVPVAVLAQVADEAAPADAAAVEEVVVTAQRRAEAAHDVPISITSLSGEMLEQSGVEQLSDIGNLTPGLRFDATGSFFQPTVRGVGTAVLTSGGGPNVGIYIDGFFSANAEVSNFQLTKLKNIQVLKGPQGTLFGRNTTGGAILVTTAEPSAETGVELKASYGSFDATKLQAYGTTGLGDNMAVDIEGVYSRGDGFIDNVATGNDEAAAYENSSIRVGFKAELSDSVSLLLRYTHGKTDDPTSLMTNAYVDEDGNSGFLSKLPTSAYGTNDTTGRALINFNLPASLYVSDPDKVATPFQNVFTNESNIFQATLKADLGFADLTSYTQYRKDESLNLQDLDSSAVPIFDMRLGIDDKTVSQELLLNSKPGSRLQWTGGLNYFRYRDLFDFLGSIQGSPFAEAGSSGTLTTSYAAFADATYEITKQWFVTVGGRYSIDKVSDAYFISTGAYENASGVPTPAAYGTRIAVNDLDNERFTPRVVLRYKPSDASSVYASYTQGYKAGILNVGGASQVPVKPEEIDAFEVGYKYEDRRLAADMAAFHYDYRNLQVSSYQSGAAQVRNAAESTIYGLDGAVRYKFTDAFSMNLGATWTHARYDSFKNAPFYSYCDPDPNANPTANSEVPSYCGAPENNGALTQVTSDASGYHMQRSPDFTATLGASHVSSLQGGVLTLSGNLYYASKFYFDPSEQFNQDAYTVLGLRAQWVDASDRYTVALFGDNLTDERYRTQVLFNSIGIGNTWSAPLTVGIELGVRF